MNCIFEINPTTWQLARSPDMQVFGPYRIFFLDIFLLCSFNVPVTLQLSDETENAATTSTDSYRHRCSKRKERTCNVLHGMKSKFSLSHWVDVKAPEPDPFTDFKE